ncbi:hypothetical protein pipiens_011222 [Culex pipiens pipiens]|uniref:Uncharacterized protein n=1 Tax=Culex pipiens pipiens TaxID=38569 RepID=A0ABD1D766_CULPP
MLVRDTTCQSLNRVWKGVLAHNCLQHVARVEVPLPTLASYSTYCILRGNGPGSGLGELFGCVLNDSYVFLGASVCGQEWGKQMQTDRVFRAER